MPFRLFKTAHQKVSDFCEGRTRQSDDEFFIDCNLPEDKDAVRVALAVRRSVARVGLIDPLYIRADDRYPEELSALPLWDSMDWLELLLCLDDELKTTIPDKDAQQIKTAGFSVRRFTHDVLEVVKRLRTG